MGAERSGGTRLARTSESVLGRPGRVPVHAVTRTALTLIVHAPLG